MGKKLDQDTINFEPADYDYLDTASLDIWVSEFLSRNKEYVNDYNKMVKMGYSDAYRYHIELYKKYKVFINYSRVVAQNSPKMVVSDSTFKQLKPFPEFKNLRKYLKSLPELEILDLKTLTHLSKPVSAHRIFERSIDVETIRDHVRKMFEFSEKGDYVTASNMNYSEGLNLDTDLESILEEFFGLPDEHSNYFCGDSLLIAINLKYPKDLIEKEIQKILKLHKKRKEKTFRFDKWKYYLIVYDLKSAYPHMSYDKLGDVLQDAYPKHKRTFDAKNCENYYKNALYLINGGYKEYL